MAAPGWKRAAACVAAAVMFVAACGSDGGDEAALAETDTVSAAEWATATCTSLGEWIAGIQESLEGLGTTADLEEAKESLAGFLGDAVERTDALVAELADAPGPDVAGGSEIAESLAAAFTDAAAALADAGEQVSALSTEDPAVLDLEAQAIVTSASEGIEAARAAIEAVGEDFDDPDLTEAFEGAEACQALIT